MPDYVVADCACGKTYSQTEWDALPAIANQHWPWGEVHDMRNCSCGSTLSVVLIDDPL